MSTKPPGLYFHDPACLEHDPGPELPWSPELPSRLRAVEEHLGGLDWLGWQPRRAPAASEQDVERDVVVAALGHDQIGPPLGRLDVLDHYLGSDGLNITQFPLQKKR